MCARGLEIGNRIVARSQVTPIATPSTDWIDLAGACIPPGLRLSFQRFLRPTSGIVGEPLPSSLGALPVGLGRQGDLIVPTADNEAFWIGLDVARAAQAIELRLSVELCSGEVLDALGAAKWNARPASILTVPPTRRIGGFADAGAGPRAFARAGSGDIDGCIRLVFRAATHAVESEAFSTAVRLVDYAAFVAESGRPPPSLLDLDSGFQGWRLP